MVNYSNGKIYKIVSSYTNMVYIGSTAKKYLCDRMYHHKSDCKTWMMGNKKYCGSFGILLYPDARIVLIESYPCNSRDELRAREQYNIDLNKGNAVNCINAFGLDFERIKQTKKEGDTKYYRKNREKILEKQNEKVLCPCGSQCSKINLLRHKQSKKHLDFMNEIAPQQI